MLLRQSLYNIFSDEKAGYSGGGGGGGGGEWPLCSAVWQPVCQWCWTQIKMEFSVDLCVVWPRTVNQ